MNHTLNCSNFNNNNIINECKTKIPLYIAISYCIIMFIICIYGFYFNCKYFSPFEKIYPEQKKEEKIEKK